MAPRYDLRLRRPHSSGAAESPRRHCSFRSGVGQSRYGRSPTLRMLGTLKMPAPSSQFMFYCFLMVDGIQFLMIEFFISVVFRDSRRILGGFSEDSWKIFGGLIEDQKIKEHE